MNVLKRILATTALLTFAAGGCANISPGKTEAIQPVTSATEPRVGNGYLFRG